MLFLGTGAAEMFPDPYCDCEVCQRARRSGSVPRKRSAFMIDESSMVDFGPDVLAASQMHGAPLFKVERVFITHTHDDHFSPSNIEALNMAAKRSGCLPIRFYISQKGLQWFKGYMEAMAALGFSGFERLQESGKAQFIPVTPYVWFDAGDMRVFAIETNHSANQGERAVNYLFDRGDKGKLLYACDTGLYSEENLRALAGQGADLLIMEGTLGNETVSRAGGHLNADHFIEQVEALVKAGALKRGAKIYVTHINQVQSFSHEEYQRYMTLHSEFDITVAFDGMRI